MRNEKQFWLICVNCNQWIHKKCMKDSCENEQNYTCTECRENPNRSVNNKRKKNTAPAKPRKNKQVVQSDDEEEITSPTIDLDHSDLESPKTIPSPMTSSASYERMPLKKRLKNPSSPNSTSNSLNSPKLSLNIAKFYTKLDVDGYSSGTSTESPTSETEDVDFSSGISPVSNDIADSAKLFYQPLSRSGSAIDLLASICEQMQF